MTQKISKEKKGYTLNFQFNCENFFKAKKADRAGVLKLLSQMASDAVSEELTTRIKERYVKPVTPEIV